jgi:hypothetical protein
MSESATMELVVGAGGEVQYIYDEAMDLRQFGKLPITRASHVEPDRDGSWWADMGPFGSRSEALRAEREWLVFGANAETA